MSVCMFSSCSKRCVVCDNTEAAKGGVVPEPVQVRFLKASRYYRFTFCRELSVAGHGE